MPPVTKAGGTQFRKDVEFVTKDDAEQVAAGIVMVPDKVDLQNDFAREDTIREFAEQFETFEEAGQAGGGIMHAVWPDGWMDLARNEVLDESEEIGGETVDAGAWVQEWSIENDQLWDLIDEGVLAGYSIGAIQVRWDGPFEQDEVDDVDTSEVPDDEFVWKLTDGIVREVSAVDIPAVPDAEILEAKGLAKRLADHVGNRDGFIEEAMERGHTEAEAQRLWDVLNEAVEADGSDEPGKQSLLQKAGKAFLTALTGSDDGASETKSPEAPDRGADKEGRTLSTANRDSLFATIDAAADVLEGAGVEHGITRFTDREDTNFDLTEHQAREWAGDHDDEDEDGDDEDEEEDMASPFELSDDNATGGDTPDDEGGKEATDDMSDDDTNTEGGDKSLAEKNAEQITELTQAVESLTETLSGPQQKTAEIELDGETYEVPEAQVKAALGVDEDAGVGVADAIESLKQQVDQQATRIDAINRQSGRSQQIEASANGDGSEDEESGLDSLGKALS